MRMPSALAFLSCFSLSLFISSCMTGSKVEQKRDPIFDEVALVGKRWRQCYVENQTIQMAQAEEELCYKVRSNFSKFSDGMTSPDNLTRIWSARHIGFAKTPEALPMLLSALNDPLEEVRVNVLFSIAFLRDPNTPMDRMTAMMSDQSDHVRHNAMHAIQKLVDVGDDRGAMPVILRGLEDRFPGVRNEAIIALMTIRDKSTAKAIIEKSLQDEYHRARINAALALGAINSPDAIEPLIGLLGNSNRHVREAAGWSLQTITGLDTENDLARWMEWWETNKSRYQKPDEAKAPSNERAPQVLSEAAAAAAAAAEEERVHRTKCSVAEFHIDMMAKAVDKFTADNGHLPAALADLVTKPADATVWPEGGYLTAVPEDPWGHAYVYRTGAENKYELFSPAGDGAEGGEGRGADIKK